MTSFTIHFTLCLILRHEQVCLMKLLRKIQRYFSHHWAWLNIWYDKFVVLWTLNKQENIYHIYLWHTKCTNLADVRWSLGHMMHMMYTKLIYIYRERGWMGWVLPPAKNVIISPTWKNPPIRLLLSPTKFLFPLHLLHKNFQVITQ